MSMSRRSFIEAGALFGMSVALPVNLFAQKGGGALPSTTNGFTIPISHFEALANLTRDDFKSCLGQDFLLFTRQGGSINIKLSEIRDLAPKETGKPSSTADESREGFVLTFTSRSQVGQDTYSLGHSRTGYFALLIVPGVKKGSLYAYDAVINRLF